MQATKKKIAILFQGPHLAYSPTTIQLYDELVNEYDVEIIAQDPSNNNNMQKLKGRKVSYHKYHGVKSRYFYLALFPLFAFFNKQARFYYKNKIGYKEYFFKFRFIKNKIEKEKYHRIIAIDLMNLLCCSLLKCKTDFLSLELCLGERNLPLINTTLIQAVIIQSKERYDYLFKEQKIKTYLIQNAPIFKQPIIKEQKNGLLYSGSSAAFNTLGFYDCLNYIKEYPNEKLTAQGAIFPEDRAIIENKYPILIHNNQLVFKTNYFENVELDDYFTNFEIGLCFFNFEDPNIKANYFNYATAPSGKLFKYLAAGVPVIANDIIGFQFVNEFKCGALVANLTPCEINKAILKVRTNYKEYENGALNAAKHFSFDKAVIPYIQEIKSC